MAAKNPQSRVCASCGLSQNVKAVPGVLAGAAVWTCKAKSCGATNVLLTPDDVPPEQTTPEPQPEGGHR